MNESCYVAKVEGMYISDIQGTSLFQDGVHIGYQEITGIEFDRELVNAKAITSEFALELSEVFKRIEFFRIETTATPIFIQNERECGAK